MDVPSKVNTIVSDVLVIGGGLAGCNAAIAAAELGARVVVIDKGKIERSGDTGGGVDHFMAFMNTGEPWDTREAFLEYCWRVGKGTIDPQVLDEVVSKEMPDALQRMERIGATLKQPDGTYYRTKSMGQPGPYWINFNGKRIKHALAAQIRHLGCTVLDKVITTDMLVGDNRVVGATGFHIRTGEFHVINGKAVVIATGNTNRLYQSPRLNPFNSWLSPFNTGDGIAMAFRAGAVLANMEYMRMTILPKGFAAPGFNAFTGMGGRFVNARGEYYMEKYHPQGNKAPRYDVVFYSLKEIKEGRGPLFIDCTQLSEQDFRHLEETLGYDKDTLPDYLRQRGEDLRNRPVEITVSEGMQAGPSEVAGSGIKVDKTSASTVPGLFACGDACDANRCVHGAVTGGYRAGKSAAAYALGLGDDAVSAGDPPADKHESAFVFLKRRGGISYGEFEDIVRKIMTEYVGTERNENGLEVALHKLASAKGLMNELRAGDLHELMRVHESCNLWQVAEVVTHAALFRKESRNKPYHHRLDYPATDDENWCGQVLVRKGPGDSVQVSFQPLTFGMPGQQEGRESQAAGL